MTKDNKKKKSGKLDDEELEKGLSKENDEEDANEEAEIEKKFRKEFNPDEEDDGILPKEDDEFDGFSISDGDTDETPLDEEEDDEKEEY